MGCDIVEGDKERARNEAKKNVSDGECDRVRNSVTRVVISIIVNRMQ